MTKLGTFIAGLPDAFKRLLGATNTPALEDPLGQSDADKARQRVDEEREAKRRDR